MLSRAFPGSLVRSILSVLSILFNFVCLLNFAQFFVKFAQFCQFCQNFVSLTSPSRRVTEFTPAFILVGSENFAWKRASLRTGKKNPKAKFLTHITHKAHNHSALIASTGTPETRKLDFRIKESCIMASFRFWHFLPKLAFRL